MILLVGGVTALFVLGRASRPIPQEEPAEGKGSPGGRQAGKKVADAAVLSEGFDYEQQVDGKPVFRLQGDRFTTDKDGKIALQGVKLELYREGQPYHVASKRANYDPNSHNAQLAGSVRLQGGDGWELESNRLELVGGGKVVVSRGDRVDIRRGSLLTGNANRLQFDLNDERLRLLSDVHFEGHQEEGGTPFTLDAQEVVWERDANTVDAERRVHLTWGDDSLRADHVHAALRADSGALEAANAEGGVTGRLTGQDEETITLAAERAGVSFDEGSGRPAQIDLGQGESKKPVRLESHRADATRRTLTASAINAELIDGRFDTARASGGVVLEETPVGSGPRVIRGDELEARFSPSNELEHAEVRGGVVIQDASISAVGDHATLDQAAQSVTLEGKPARARNTDKSELNAPHIVYALDHREVKAEGGVQGTFQPKAAILPSAGASADRRQPIQIEAESGSFSESTHQFRFSGKVQAVQGESLLFADLLEGDQSAGTARASGKVRTIWRDPGAASGGPENLTIASADQLDYDRKAGELRYSGNVQVRQQSREIRAEATRVELDEHQQARRMFATGAIRIDDHESGRTIEGAEADYDFTTRSAIVTGEPVVIHDRDGTILRGRRALFDVATGAAKILSEAS